MIANLIHLLTYNPEEPLFFSSGLFLVFFLLLSFLYMVAHRRTGLREVFVLLFSTYFYYKSSGAAVLLLLFITLSDYLIARAIDTIEKRGQRLLLLALSILIDIGSLAFFKYADVLAQQFNIRSIEDLIMPIGISFYLPQCELYGGCISQTLACHTLTARLCLLRYVLPCVACWSYQPCC
jgi:D-alanyl-lipoteichoic acid acyltransferase DltB (MBOAT superfamily)